MIDLKKHEYEEQDYQEFVSYVRGTWRDLFEWGDFKEEVEIKKVLVSGEGHNFDVFVYINDNTYYQAGDGKYYRMGDEIKEVAYDGKPIKTSYTLRSQDILYIILKGTLMGDLGLSEDVEFIVTDYVDGIQHNEYLSRSLEGYEESWAEARYCAIHDL